MYYVYLLKYLNFPNQIYVGFTNNLKQRITDHNYGKSPHTSKYRPWELISYHVFNDEKRAIAFEKYLKSHSGRAFIVKRLL